MNGAFMNLAVSSDTLSAQITYRWFFAPKDNEYK